MMGGGTFLLLKVCSLGPESMKQAEIRLANLLKILRNFGSGGQYPSPMRGRRRAVVVFQRFPLDIANLIAIITLVI
jgi:hypothetical protein